MLEDGARARGDEVEVLDVAQVVRRSLAEPEPSGAGNPTGHDGAV